jgi:hypothetical protein
MTIMEDGSNQVPEINTEQNLQLSPINNRRRAQIIVITGIILVLVLGVLIIGIFLLLSPNINVARIRDVFIIFMALESLLIGVALVVLMVQLSRLINLFNNEVRPILNSTNETVNTLRGTTAFLSNNLVEPVIKLNEYLASVQEMLKIFGFKKK